MEPFLLVMLNLNFLELKKPSYLTFYYTLLCETTPQLFDFFNHPHHKQAHVTLLSASLKYHKNDPDLQSFEIHKKTKKIERITEV